MILSRIDRVLSTQSHGRALIRAHTRPCGRLDSHNQQPLSVTAVSHRRLHLASICKAASTALSGSSQDEQTEPQTATENAAETATENAAAEEEVVLEELEYIDEAEEDEGEDDGTQEDDEGFFSLGVDTLFQVCQLTWPCTTASVSCAHLLDERAVCNCEASAVQAELARQDIRQPSPIQTVAIPKVLAGANCAIQSYTGSGKVRSTSHSAAV
jgi:hypothetical protein